jgi:hypothetical protein
MTRNPLDHWRPPYPASDGVSQLRQLGRRGRAHWKRGWTLLGEFTA